MNLPDAPAAGAPAEVARRPRLLGLIGGIGAGVVVVDQLTKSWAVDELAHRVIPVFWTLRLNLSFNSGLAFSQGSGLTDLITVAGICLVVALGWWATRITRSLPAVALALLLGGACGNLADRLFRDYDGAVVDFIDFQFWPIFNIADVALSTGCILLIATSFREAGSEPAPTGTER